MLTKRVLCVACLLCFPAWGSALGDKITIDAPSAAQVGESLQITIRGIDTADLPKAVAKHWPRDGVTFIPARTWGGEPFVWWIAKKPGNYIVEVFVPVLVNGVATLEHAEAVIVVGGDPEPSPNPIPPPVPTPGERSFVVVCETGQRTAAEAAMIGKLLSHFRSTGDRYFWRIVDRDMIDGVTKQTPTWLLPYLTALNKTPTKVPALVVLAQTQASKNTSPNSTASSVVAVEPLAGLTGEKAIALVKKHGGG